MIQIVCGYTSRHAQHSSVDESAQGGVVYTRRKVWIFSIFAAGLLLNLGCSEDVSGPNSQEEGSPSAALATAAAPLSFANIYVGPTHTCGVTTTNLAYCWGLNYFGQLGNGSFGAAVTSRPVAAAGNMRFLEVRVGANFTCGLTTENHIYCWGLNTDGQLGNGSNSTDSQQPVLVDGGRRYRLLRVAPAHACAIALSGVTFCWGLNNFGQLGDGSTLTRRAPVKVAGTTVFRTVSTGIQHTCGLSLAKKAYCWGRNTNGQLGNLSSLTRLTPGPVADGRFFNTVSAGAAHTCAVTPEKRAYCWGKNDQGSLGDGTTLRRSRPTAVSGDRAFVGVSAGAEFTCGITSAKQAFCWGSNHSGQLGDGTDGQHSPFVSRRLSPVAVSGGHLFSHIVAALGDGYTCAVTTDARGYCWGNNHSGQVGDGTSWFIIRNTPTAVIGPA
jgi:alpha-tubulin suppressor-like RCC1 family protein